MTEKMSPGIQKTTYLQTIGIQGILLVQIFYADRGMGSTRFSPVNVRCARFTMRSVQLPWGLNPGEQDRKGLKPQYILLPVIAICFGLIVLLPYLRAPIPADAAVFATPIANSAAGSLPVVTLAPEQAAAPESRPASEAQAPAGEPAPAADEPAADQPQAQAGMDNLHAVDAAALGDSGLQEFAATVYTGQAGAVTGVYAPGVLALPVTGQPGGDMNYVSPDDNILTQYGKPAQYGVIAVLAHNYLNSGKSFYQLKAGQDVYAVFGDGRAARFRVSQISYYQALDPTNVYSDFRDLNGPGGDILSSDQLFERLYTSANRLVFQTCFEANGDPSWGRMFVMAEPAG